MPYMQATYRVSVMTDQEFRWVVAAVKRWHDNIHLLTSSPKAVAQRWTKLAPTIDAGRAGRSGKWPAVCNASNPSYSDSLYLGVSMLSHSCHMTWFEHWHACISSNSPKRTSVPSWLHWLLQVQRTACAHHATICEVQLGSPGIGFWR